MFDEDHCVPKRSGTPSCAKCGMWNDWESIEKYHEYIICTILSMTKNPVTGRQFFPRGYGLGFVCEIWVPIADPETNLWPLVRRIQTTEESSPSSGTVGGEYGEIESQCLLLAEKASHFQSRIWIWYCNIPLAWWDDVRRVGRDGSWWTRLSHCQRSLSCVSIFLRRQRLRSPFSYVVAFGDGQGLMLVAWVWSLSEPDLAAMKSCSPPNHTPNFFRVLGSSLSFCRWTWRIVGSFSFVGCFFRCQSPTNTQRGNRGWKRGSVGFLPKL